MPAPELVDEEIAGMPPAQDDAEAFCRDMLPKVSRTFAACIGLLPPRLEYAVLVAYLLCRVADTIEDCPRLSPERKRALLERFADSLEQEVDELGELAEIFAEPILDDELLAQRADLVHRAFRSLEQQQRAAIRPWVQEMSRGMAGFALSYTGAKPGCVEALRSVDELDRYCYYVAGTVGHMLTELFHLHHHRVTEQHYLRMKRLATSFGLGLQLTNIIKDVADDRRRGWSFVPRQLCRLAEIAPEDFLQPEQQDRARWVMDRLIEKAGQHLRDALDYCLAIPRSQYRMRIFCLTPLFFAVRTLALASRDPQLLDPDHKVKISRAEVKRIIRDSFVIAPDNRLVRAYFRRLAARSPVPV